MAKYYPQVSNIILQRPVESTAPAVNNPTARSTDSLLPGSWHSDHGFADRYFGQLSLWGTQPARQTQQTTLHSELWCQCCNTSPDLCFGCWTTRSVGHPGSASEVSTSNVRGYWWVLFHCKSSFAILKICLETSWCVSLILFDGAGFWLKSGPTFC